jgi:hypothetical protein
MSQETAPTPARSPLPEWLFYAGLAILFLAPSQLAYAVTHKDGPFIGYTDVLAGLICLLALVVVALGNKWRELAYPPIGAWALVVLAVLSASNAVQPVTAAVEIVKFALDFVAVYMLFLNTLTDRRRVRLAVLVLLTSTTLVVAGGAAQYFRQLHGAAFDPMAVRAGFTNRNTYSAFLALVLPLALAAALHTRHRLWRVWWALLTAGGLLTMLSGPLIWLTVVTLAWVGLSARSLARWSVLAALAVFVALVMYALPHHRAAAVTELAAPYETNLIHVPQGAGAPQDVPIVKKRWLEWAPALHLLGDHFVLGVGAGNYQLNIGQYYEGLPNVKKSEPDTNNLYLVIAGSLGFLGLVALFALFGHFWRLSSVLWSYADDNLGRALAAGLPAAMLALGVGNLFTAMLVRGLSLVIVFLFALIEVRARRPVGPPPGA